VFGFGHGVRRRRRGAGSPGPTGLDAYALRDRAGAYLLTRTGEKVYVRFAPPEGTLLTRAGEPLLTRSGQFIKKRGGGAAAGAPVPTAAPTIGFFPVEGATLIVGSNGEWTNTPTAFAYQWMRGLAEIPGATGSSYVLTAADVGQTITLRVRASNEAGSNPALSNAIGPVLSGAPQNFVAPSIVGYAVEGYELSVDNGTWGSSPTSFTYQWKSAGVAIFGATQSTYTPSVTEAGKVMTCVVTASNAFDDTTVETAATAAVVALPTGEDFLRTRSGKIIFSRFGSALVARGNAAHLRTRAGEVLTDRSGSPLSIRVATGGVPANALRRTNGDPFLTTTGDYIILIGP